MAFLDIDGGVEVGFPRSIRPDDDLLLDAAPGKRIDEVDEEAFRTAVLAEMEMDDLHVCSCPSRATTLPSMSSAGGIARSALR